MSRRKRCTPSYGLILHSYAKEDLEPVYLIAKRRDTMEYSDYIKGIYSDSELPRLVSLMSTEERNRVETHSFTELWNDMYIDSWRDDSVRKAVYRRASERFETSLPIVRELLVVTSRSDYVPRNFEPQWGFPKGRKNTGEDDIITAIREFEEETNIKIHDAVKIWNFPPFIEIFHGTSRKYYSSKYYIAEVPTPIEPQKILLPNNIRKETISDEVSDVKWICLKEAHEYLCERRTQLLRNVDTTIRHVNTLLSIS